jgi:hypothetical protein
MKKVNAFFLTSDRVSKELRAITKSLRKSRECFIEVYILIIDEKLLSYTYFINVVCVGNVYAFLPFVFLSILSFARPSVYPGNTERGSTTVPLTSCLTSLEPAV